MHLFGRTLRCLIDTSLRTDGPHGSAWRPLQRGPGRRQVGATQVEAALSNVFLRIFLMPGEMVANSLGMTAPDDRGMMRTMINMLFWNLIGATIALYLA